MASMRPKKIAEVGAGHTAVGRSRLLGIAVSRGCTHYRSFVAPAEVSDDPSIPHEFLGCALLQGEDNLETFQAIRVGAMVLSDPRNDVALMKAYAEELKVSARLVQLARLF